MNGPDFIVAGFPKCGTTWLYDRLRELPDFGMPTGKELHFFSRHQQYNLKGETGATRQTLNLRKLLLRNFGIGGVDFFLHYLKFWQSNEQLYLRLFDALTGISGDVTPIYSMLPIESVKRLARLVPETKIVFIMRNPVDRAWSHFRMYLRNNGKRFDKLEEEEMHWFFNRPLMRNRGGYREAIEKYQQCFPPENISIHFYDQLRQAPEAFLAEIVGFLGGRKETISEYCTLDAVSNASKQIAIPEQVEEYLRVLNQSELEWTKENFPEQTEAWR
ncbi:MAG: sulfotransferase domain-containing protein [Bacteroidota bacterium]